EQARHHGAEMSRAVFITATVAALIAAAGGGFIVGRAQHSTVPMISTVAAASAKPGGAPIYFQDPDNKPFYSLTPRKTSDGRDYRSVPAGSDVSFEEPPALGASTAQAGRK